MICIYDIQVDGIFDKVGYDPEANSQVTRRAPGAGDAEQGEAPVGGGLPRIDLSTLLEKVRVVTARSAAAVEMFTFESVACSAVHFTRNWLTHSPWSVCTVLFPWPSYLLFSINRTA